LSNPETIFDSKQIFRDEDIPTSEEQYPLFWDTQVVSGGGVSYLYNELRASVTLSTTTGVAGKIVRQTRRCFDYQPGKGQLIYLTGIFGEATPGTTKRYGLFDDGNGLFYEVTSDGIFVVRRSDVTGTPVDTRVHQNNPALSTDGTSVWNVDSYDGTGRVGNSSTGAKLNLAAGQIFILDFEWLGVGSASFGNVLARKPFVTNIFTHANSTTSVYMRTPNLPLRCEIENDGTGDADEIEQICSTVISEGGRTELGIRRYISTDLPVSLAAADTWYPVLGVRLRPTHLGQTIKPRLTDFYADSNKAYRWGLVINPPITDTFDVPWANVVNSGLQRIISQGGATAPTVIGNTGTLTFLDGGYGAGRVDSFGVAGDNDIILGSSVDGVPDELYLCVNPLAVQTPIEAALTSLEV
jgi:hypothetical protein